MDPITIGLLVGSGMGLLQGQKNEKKMAQDARLKAELARYSPWSDLATNISAQGPINLPDSEASLFKGAAMGASMGNLFGGATAAAPTASSTALSAGTPGALGAASGANPTIYGSNLQYANMLGGVDAARNLGTTQSGLQFSPYTMLALSPSYPR